MSTYASGIARNVASGRVFVRLEINEELRKFQADLNYASTQGAIRSVTQLRQIGQSVLDELRRNFPDRKAGAQQVIRSKLGYRALKPKALRLKSGWRVRFYDIGFGAQNTSLLGFSIEHSGQSLARIRTILESLEAGSRAYRITPVKAEVLRFPDKYPNGTKEIFAKFADIPARAGFAYLEKTRRYADQLLASRGSNMETTLYDILENGKRFRERELTVNSIDRSLPDNWQGLEETLATARSSTRNPLARYRTAKNKLRNRTKRKTL